jgi:hypothetical protein
VLSGDVREKRREREHNDENLFYFILFFNIGEGGMGMKMRMFMLINARYIEPFIILISTMIVMVQSYIIYYIIAILMFIDNIENML